jgi:sec-independent protein translocase protein TatA
MLPGVIEPWHLVLILIIALVVFGPGKLGDVGGALGRGIREFKTSMNTEETASTDQEVKTETKTSDNGKTEVTEKVEKVSKAS